jgi:hypothetical protein
MNNGSVNIKRGGTGGRDQGVGRSGCEVGQDFDEVDTAGELILVIWASISSTANLRRSNAGKEASRSRDLNLPSHFATPDLPIRFRCVYADPQYATHAYWRQRDTIRPIRTYVRLVRTNGNAGPAFSKVGSSQSVIAVSRKS